MQYQSHSLEETQQIAKTIAAHFMDEKGRVVRGGVISLMGELGAGKTTFTQGFAKALGIEEKVISPTFVLMRQHQVPKTKFVLYHLDLYRIENLKNINDLGIQELIEDENSIILIEWAEKLETQAIFDMRITISVDSENNRKIIVS